MIEIEQPKDWCKYCGNTKDRGHQWSCPTLQLQKPRAEIGSIEGMKQKLAAGLAAETVKAYYKFQKIKSYTYRGRGDGSIAVVRHIEEDICITADERSAIQLIDAITHMEATTQPDREP